MIRPSSHRLILLATVILLAACTAPPQTEEGPPLEPCKLPRDVDAQCGSLTVPENRDDPGGRQLDLHFAVIPAESSLPETDPVVMLAGGPGQAATEVYPLVLSAFDDLNQDRDIVLLDQRGTGQSHPLDCPDLQELPLDSSRQEVLDTLEACRQTLAQRADLTQYTTDVAMRDLDAVRQTLGYRQINLLGTSYGSRAALRYMALFPHSVRTVVLNSSVSSELILQLQAPADGQRALSLLFKRCQQNAACRDAFPDFQTAFDEARLALEEGQPVTFMHPISGQRETFELGQDDYMEGLFTLLYSPELVSLLPLMVDETVKTGDYGPLVAQMVALTAGLNNYQGMFHAVVCSEDAPFIDLQEAQRLQEGSLFPLRAEDLVMQCENWPRATLAPSFREPLHSDIPTLLLSGEADPITPPHYAAQVARGLNNSLHLILPGFGHDVMLPGCMPSVITAFIQAGTLQDLQTNCVQEIVPPAFFVSPAGPKP